MHGHAELFTPKTPKPDEVVDFHNAAAGACSKDTNAMVRVAPDAAACRRHCDFTPQAIAAFHPVAVTAFSKNGNAWPCGSVYALDGGATR